MPRGYYTNPVIGQSIENLTAALVGDPMGDVKAGLLGDRRRTEQTQRERLAEMTRGQVLENDNLSRRNALAPDLGGAVAGMFGLDNLDPAQAALLGEYVGRGGGNAEQSAGGLQELAALLLSTGDEADNFRSLNVRGLMPDQDTAVTLGGQERVAGRNAAADLNETLQLAEANNEADIMQTLLGIDSREDIAALDRASREKVAAMPGSSRNAKPSAVSATERKMIEGLIDAIPGQFKADDIDPALYQSIMVRANEIYQQTGNPDQAVAQAQAELIGSDPTINDPWGRAGPTIMPRENATTRAMRLLQNPNLAPEDRALLLQQYPELAGANGQ